MEHYLELYATQNAVSDTAINAIPDLPVLDELDADPTEEELSKAIDCLSTGKAPGEEGIPPEIMQSGKDALLQDLHELFCQCWREGAMPKDMRNSKVVTLYKNKSDRSDSNIYRGISTPCSVLCTKSLPDSLWPAYRLCRLVSTQSLGVDSKLVGPPSTWCSLYDNCMRNAVNRTRAYTSPS